MKKINKNDLKKLNNTKNTKNKIKQNIKKKNNVSKNKKTKRINNINTIKNTKNKVVDLKPKKDKNNHNKNKNSYKITKKIIISFVILILLILSLLLVYPRFKKDIEKRKLSNEVIDTIDLFDKEYDIEKIKKDFNTDITSGELNKLEKNIEDYLLKTITLKDKINKIENDRDLKYALLNNELLFDERITRLDNILNNIKSTQEEYNSLINNKVSSISSNKDIDKEYNKYISIINDKINVDILDSIINSIPQVKDILIYLRDNSAYYEINDNMITFKKRIFLEKYDSLVKDLNNEIVLTLESKLIEDKIGPVITANNISVYEGASLNVLDKIKCYDDVDDLVNCNVTGEYNTNKVGEYSLVISSTDKSGNTTSKQIKVIVNKKVVVPSINTSKPYYIEVIRNQNVVVVYGKDANGNYSKIVKVFICSVGRNNYTPLGTFKTSKGYTWGALFGGVYGQYSTRITGHILFHSVPYYTKDKGNLEWQEFNKLGTSASAGCVRMTVRDVKWIYDNISAGTTVKIYDGALPNGVVKPTIKKIPADSPNRGWDPTDPDLANPWNK